jgi:hypothetical protein
LPAPRKYYEARKQSPEMIAEMDRLLDDHNYRDIARILNEKGFKTGDGLPLTSEGVTYIRSAYGLKSRFDRLRARGLLTRYEIAEKYAVSTEKIWRWRRGGLLHAHFYNDQNRCLYEDPGPNPLQQHILCPTLRPGSSRGAV